VDGWRLIAVCLKCQDSWSDCEALLRWGFDNYQMTQVIAAGIGGYDCPVQHGDVRTVTALPTDDLFLPISRRVAPPRPRVDLAPVTAPVAAEQPLGTLHISHRGLDYEIPLTAAVAVEKSVWATLAESRERVAAVLFLVALSFGVLVHGTTAKIARARGSRVPQRKREDHLSRARVGEWQGDH
jgi:D-alanyl-D-alanine carboxypeptidase